jgi:hypothetical protein
MAKEGPLPEIVRGLYKTGEADLEEETAER